MTSPPPPRRAVRPPASSRPKVTGPRFETTISFRRAAIAYAAERCYAASPAVASWNKPVILYSVVPQEGLSKDDFTKALNRRTQQAARSLLANPALQGKTVVMVWEHKHIANEELDAKFENEREGVTLRQLLKLDILPGVPKTWPDDTYDYFWIVEFPENSNVPSKFSMMKQEFGTSFPRVPANDWGAPDGLDAASGCKADVPD